ncbi:MAG: glutaredoxin family protein [Methanomicrobiales archaeon]|nr:glutaredoxin family protein [Methanomicrobiales archaeon]
MSDISGIIVYSLENCPNCELLKDFLSAAGAAFEVRDMMSPAALTELRINGVFVREAPVLQVGSTFLTSRDLFSGGSVKKEILSPLLEGE